MRTVRAVRFEVGPEPLRARPKEAEAGLDCGAEVGFSGSEFVEEQCEVERNDAPDERGVLEGSAYEFDETVPIKSQGARAY